MLSWWVGSCDCDINNADDAAGAADVNDDVADDADDDVSDAADDDVADAADVDGDAAGAADVDGDVADAANVDDAGKKINRVACGSAHSVAWSTNKHSTSGRLPTQIPLEYNHLQVCHHLHIRTWPWCCSGLALVFIAYCIMLCFVSTNQQIGCKECHQNDLFCVKRNKSVDRCIKYSSRHQQWCGVYVCDMQGIAVYVLRNRLILLHHFSEVFCPCIPMFDLEPSVTAAAAGAGGGGQSADLLRALLVSSAKVTHWTPSSLHIALQ